MLHRKRSPRREPSRKPSKSTTPRSTKKPPRPEEKVPHIYAVDIRTGDVVVAKNFSEKPPPTWYKNVRRYYRCPVPECDAPELKFVHRHAARDGFSHIAGSHRHSWMTMLHLQSQLRLVDWIRARYPSVSVTMETVTEDRRRRADVMATFSNGDRLAIEVQYSALAAADLLARSRSYQEQGIAVCWLLVSKEPAPPSGDSFYSRKLLHSAIAQLGSEVLMFDYRTEKLGLVTADDDVPRLLVHGDRDVIVRWCSLSAVTLSSIGLNHPLLPAASAAREQYLVAARQPSSQRVALRDRWPAPRRRSVEKVCQPDDAMKETLRDEWVRSEEYVSMMRSRDLDLLVSVVDTDAEMDHRVPIHPRWLRYYVCQRIVAVGGRGVTEDDLVAAVIRRWNLSADMSSVVQNAVENVVNDLTSLNVITWFPDAECLIATDVLDYAVSEFPPGDTFKKL